MSLLFDLFFAFVRVGLLSFGGGYAALPVIQDMVVGTKGWLESETFADILVIAEMTPGPITINTATFVGTKMAGLTGSVAATMGFVFPSVVIISVFSVILKKYGNLKAVGDVLSIMRPAVIGLIAAAGTKLLVDGLMEGCALFASFDFWCAILFAFGVLVMRLIKPSPIIMMVSCGVIGGLIYYVFGL